MPSHRRRSAWQHRSPPSSAKRRRWRDEAHQEAADRAGVSGGGGACWNVRISRDVSFPLAGIEGACSPLRRRIPHHPKRPRGAEGGAEMTIEELAKLKKGDRLVWRGDVVTLDRVQAVVRNNLIEVHLNLEFLDVLSGPALPPHVAEVFEWDGEPQGFKQEDGWVWHEGWKWPH